MEIVSVALNFIMTGLIIFFAISFIFLIRRNMKNKRIVDCITAFDDESLFFDKINTYLETMKDPEFMMKGKILKLWGTVYYEHNDEILPLLHEIDIIPLIDNKGFFKKDKVQLNEDSFYYLFIACVNTLYGRNDVEKLEEFMNKIIGYEELLKPNLVYQIAMQTFNLYENKNDLGEAFYKRVLEGDYSEYKYAKQLIGLYKELCAAYLAKIYSLQNRESEYDIIRSDVLSFNEKKIGKRILLELQVPSAWLSKLDQEEIG
ncbi:hypothetical protein [Anaerorhabdus sp.]|uniref:hypothetical protein n=1 Tax=Anaerorhabdus sp. TaxID=1872524 RepID=UPI002FCC4E33